MMNRPTRLPRTLAGLYLALVLLLLLPHLQFGSVAAVWHVVAVLDLIGALWLAIRLARHTVLRPGERHVVLVDGECVACNRIVSTILRLDRRGVFQFAHLQSDWARRVVGQHGHDPSDVDPIYLLANAGSEHEVLLIDGEAGREIWPRLLRVGLLARLFPLALLDLQYRAFARIRYRVAGKYDRCYVPSEQERERFVE